MTDAPTLIFSDTRDASVISPDRHSDVSGKASRFSSPSSHSVSSRRATVGVQHPLTDREAWFLSARYLKLGIGTTLGALALFLSSNERLNKYLYGPDWERAWIWWTITVPFYLFCTIYFTRFVGSYLMRIWMWEIVNSPWVHEAVITLLAGIFSEDSADDLLTAALAKPTVVEGVSTLTAALINSDAVQGASINTVIGVLLSPRVQDAAVMSVERLLADRGLIRALASLLGNEKFAAPVARQIARIMENEELASALISFVQQMLEHQDVRDVMKRRAKSVAGDAELYGAASQGLWESVVGRRDPGPTHAVSILEVPYAVDDAMVGPSDSRDSSGCIDGVPCRTRTATRPAQE